jgi:hypothetical protein
MSRIPLSDFLAKARYRGMVLSLRFPGGLSGMFGGIEFDMFVTCWEPEEERRWVTVHCDRVFDFGMSPSYTLLEGLPDIEFTRHDPLLHAQRLNTLWCDENEPQRDRAALALLRCGGSYVIAEKFTLTERK